MTPEEIVERAAEVMARHSIGAFNFAQSACDGCGVWMKHAEYRRHLVQELALAGLLGDLAAVWDEGWNASADYMSDAYDGPDEVTNPHRREVTPWAAPIPTSPPATCCSSTPPTPR